MLTDAQRELLKTQPERFSSVIFHIPEFAALNLSSISVELAHEGRYLAESELSGKPIIDPHTPGGPLVSLGTIKEIQELLEDPSELNQALKVIFSVVNECATKAVRNNIN